MNNKINRSENVKQHLDRRDVYLIKKIHRGMELACEKGILWVTQSGDLRDYLLVPGQRMVIKKHGRVLVEAMRDVDFKIVSPNKARLN